MAESKQTKYGIKGLVIAGLVSAFTGLSLMIRPVPYASMGGDGPHGRTPVMSVFAGNDSAYIGLLLLFTGSFILAVACKLRKP